MTKAITPKLPRRAPFDAHYFGEIIAAEFGRRRPQRRRVSRALGLHPDTLCTYIAGSRPDPDVCVAIARLRGINPNYLLHAAGHALDDSFSPLPPPLLDAPPDRRLLNYLACRLADRVHATNDPRVLTRACQAFNDIVDAFTAPPSPDYTPPARHLATVAVLLLLSLACLAVPLTLYYRLPITFAEAVAGPLFLAITIIVTLLWIGTAPPTRRGRLRRTLAAGASISAAIAVPQLGRLRWGCPGSMTFINTTFLLLLFFGFVGLRSQPDARRKPRSNTKPRRAPANAPSPSPQPLLPPDTELPQPIDPPPSSR